MLLGQVRYPYTRQGFSGMRVFAVRPMRAHRVVSILLILATLVFSLAGPPPDATAQSAPRSGRKVIVDNGDRQLASELAGRSGTVLVDYGAFSLWSVPDPVADTLKGRA